MMNDQNIVAVVCTGANGKPTDVMYAANPVTISGEGRIVITPGTFEGAANREVGENPVALQGLMGGNCRFSSMALVERPPFRSMDAAFTSKFTCWDLKAPPGKVQIAFQGEARGALQFDYAAQAIRHPHLTETNQSTTVPVALTPQTAFNCAFAPGQITPGVPYKG